MKRLTEREAERIAFLKINPSLWEMNPQWVFFIMCGENLYSWKTNVEDTTAVVSRMIAEIKSGKR